MNNSIGERLRQISAQEDEGEEMPSADALEQEYEVCLRRLETLQIVDSGSHAFSRKAPKILATLKRMTEIVEFLDTMSV